MAAGDSSACATDTVGLLVFVLFENGHMGYGLLSKVKFARFIGAANRAKIMAFQENLIVGFHYNRSARRRKNK